MELCNQSQEDRDTVNPLERGSLASGRLAEASEQASSFLAEDTAEALRGIALAKRLTAAWHTCGAGCTLASARIRASARLGKERRADAEAAE